LTSRLIRRQLRQTDTIPWHHISGADDPFNQGEDHDNRFGKIPGGASSSWGAASPTRRAGSAAATTCWAAAAWAGGAAWTTSGVKQYREDVLWIAVFVIILGIILAGGAIRMLK
jgi:hypothetical protein